MTARPTRSAALALALALAAAAACAPPAKAPAPVALAPVERFDWVSQPVEFAPPPPAWERQAENSGGRLGVFFTHRGSVGERIIVAAYRLLAERDRRAALRDLRERCESMTAREFARAAALARPRTEGAISREESEVAARVHAALDRAIAEHFAGRPLEARFAMSSAVAAAESYVPGERELLERIRFRREDRQEPHRYGEVTDSAGTVDGLPALVQRYGFRGDSDSLECREVFVVANGTAFTASFMGLEENLPLFEAVVASMRFPAAGRGADGP